MKLAAGMLLLFGIAPPKPFFFMFYNLHLKTNVMLTKRPGKAGKHLPA